MYTADLSMITVAREGLQFSSKPGRVRGLGQCLPALHNEHQQQFHQLHNVEGRPLVSLQSTL